MKLKFTALTIAILLASPMLWSGEHDSERIDTEHRASNPRAKMRLEELKELHKQAEDFNAHNEKLRAHHAPYSDASDWADTSATSLTPEKGFFTKLTNSLTDSFKKLFNYGNKAKVSNALSKHDLFTATEKDAFKNLDPKDQEEVLNDWLTDEVAKRKENEKKSQAEYDAQKQHYKKLKSTLEKDKLLLIKGCSDAVSSVKEVIGQSQSEEMTSIDKLTDNLITDHMQQESFNAAIDKLITKLETQKTELRSTSISSLEAIDNKISQLRRAKTTVTENVTALKNKMTNLDQANKNLEIAFHVDQFNVRHSFNLRIMKFRNDIKSLLGKDSKLTLKYNPKTEKFVLVERTEGSGAKSEAAPAESASGTTVSPTDGTPTGDGKPAEPVTQAEATSEEQAFVAEAAKAGDLTASEQANDFDDILKGFEDEDGSNTIPTGRPSQTFSTSVNDKEIDFDELMAQVVAKLEEADARIKESSLTRPQQEQAEALVEDEATLARDAIKQAEAKKIAEKDAQEKALTTELDRFSSLNDTEKVALMQKAISEYDQLSQALQVKIKSIATSSNNYDLLENSITGLKGQAVGLFNVWNNED